MNAMIKTSHDSLLVESLLLKTITLYQIVRKVIMKTVFFVSALLILKFHLASCLIPPKFQWSSIDFAWQSCERCGEGLTKAKAVSQGLYVVEHNLPTGIARWKDKLFITIPRWKKGVPASLNYVYLNGTQDQPLIPYPSWEETGVIDSSGQPRRFTNSSVVSTFRIHVDTCDRLWVVDNGVIDMMGEIKQVVDPAILVFDLNTDKLIHRYELENNVLRPNSVLASVIVDIINKNCADTFAYVADMGSNAIIVYSFKDNDSWRVEHRYFHFDPHASVYVVGGIEFFWNDGISSMVLSKSKNHGFRDLYLHPTSSTKLFRMSTKLLRDKCGCKNDLDNGVEIIGDKGNNSQATAVDLDSNSNVLFYTQLNKNGIACWNTDKPFKAGNTPVVVSDCNLLEFPSDLKVDNEGNVWILSNRQSRFLYDTMDFKQINFRVMTAPAAALVQGTPCEKQSSIGKAFSFVKKSKSFEKK